VIRAFVALVDGLESFCARGRRCGSAELRIFMTRGFCLMATPLLSLLQSLESSEMPLPLPTTMDSALHRLRVVCAATARLLLLLIQLGADLEPFVFAIRAMLRLLFSRLF